MVQQKKRADSVVLISHIVYLHGGKITAFCAYKQTILIKIKNCQPQADIFFFCPYSLS